MTIQDLKDRLVELQQTSKAIQDKADAEKRQLDDDEAGEIEAIFAEFDAVDADIKRRQRIEAQETRVSSSAGRVTTPSAPDLAPRHAPTNVAAGRQPDGLQNTRISTVEDRQRWGFRNFGEFAQSVAQAARNPSGMDQRLIQNAAATTYGSEGVSADGGFAVPPEWRSSIQALVMGDAESLLPRCDTQDVSGNSITYPVDENAPWHSGGIQSYWDGEGDTITQSKPKLKDVSVKLHRLTALVPVTDELMADAAALSGYISSKVGESMAFKVTDAIVNGTGVGLPLGIMNAPCLVSVAKETSQSAATIHGRNITKMIARMPARSYNSAVWLINQDCVPQVMALGLEVTKADGTAAGAGSIYLPPNGLANSSPYGTLMGRPIVVTEACQTVGTVGDIVLANLSKYLAVVKTGGVRSDISMHLWFDQALTAFRFIMRMNGQPWLSAPIARKNGSNTLSDFVALATRS